MTQICTVLQPRLRPAARVGERAPLVSSLVVGVGLYPTPTRWFSVRVQGCVLLARLTEERAIELGAEPAQDGEAEAQRRLVLLAREVLAG